MSLKIAIDGRMFDQSGIGRYIRNLISHLQLIDKKNEYFILLDKDNYKNLKFQENFHKVSADFHWYGLSEQVKLLKILKDLKPDLTHFPHFNVPLFYRGTFIVTIHDLIHQHFSMERATTHGSIIYGTKKAGYKIIFKNAVFKSAKILTPSNFVKNQLARDWQVKKDKIIVTPEAVDNNIKYRRGLFSRRLENQKSKIKNEKILEGLNIKKPYIFYVGNAHPHKNIEGLIRVFRELGKRYPKLLLVLAGNDHYFWQKIKKDNKQENIIFTDFVSDEQLVVLYKEAEMFVMPSFEEGFGIPILEAMVCQCPVVSSNAGSLQEVGADAAIYFDPSSADDMAEKISQVLGSQRLREQLVEKGLKRSKDFSWEKLAKQTLEVYLAA